MKLTINHGKGRKTIVIGMDRQQTADLFKALGAPLPDDYTTQPGEPTEPRPPRVAKRRAR